MSNLKNIVGVCFVLLLIGAIASTGNGFGNIGFMILIPIVGVLLFIFEAGSQLHDYRSKPKATTSISKKQKTILIIISLLIIIAFIVYWPFLGRWV